VFVSLTDRRIHWPGRRRWDRAAPSTDLPWWGAPCVSQHPLRFFRK